jgi:Fe-S-cluster-containing dehydrogenase component/formate-dependent nitrite reductase membrane component NrfD
VACKSENDVPVGSFRTWVKYVEHGAYPDVRRSFAVLRCNQCSDAPCITICPVRALDKRDDGIVDIDPAACVGCKACMQACPYDALYLNDGTGTAQKCHFCAHRVEAGLAPACAVVCPTEAIVPGDFHDPDSTVSRMRAEHDLTVRKAEAGTGPNVLYRDAHPAGLEPLRADASGGYLWAGRGPGAAPEVERFQAELEDAERRARSVYDVDHRAWWGGKVSAYLWTKSIAAGAVLALAALLGPLLRAGTDGLGMIRALPAIGRVFLAITTGLLVADLKRPERFLYLLTRPNPGSWLVRGAWILMAYGAILTAWLVWAVLGTPGGPAAGPLAVVAAIVGVLAAGYTGWLFAQCRGRVLWLARGLWLRFALHALAAGAATALIAGAFVGVPLEVAERARWVLIATLVAEALLGEVSHRAAPRGREAEFRRVVATTATGPFRSRRRAADVVGFYLAMPLLVIGPQVPTAGDAVFWTAGAVLVLIGLALEQDVLVRAGQAVPIS